MAVLVVLGCRPLRSADGRLCGALGRRIGAASAAFCPGDRIVVTGGRSWDGVVEADAMREELLRAGIASAPILRERCSLTTRDNAALSADLLRRMGETRVVLVTCAWHLPRAMTLFRAEGIEVDPMPVPSPSVRWVTRWYRTVYECVASRVSASPGVA